MAEGRGFVRQESGQGGLDPTRVRQQLDEEDLAVVVGQAARATNQVKGLRQIGDELLRVCLQLESVGRWGTRNGERVWVVGGGRSG